MIKEYVSERIIDELEPTKLYVVKLPYGSHPCGNYAMYISEGKEAWLAAWSDQASATFYGKLTVVGQLLELPLCDILAIARSMNELAASCGAHVPGVLIIDKREEVRI